MIRKLTAVALFLGTFAAPAAFAEEGAVDAAMQETLTAQLVAEGYDVRQFKAEDGLIEVYVVKDGKMEELWFDASLTRVEHEEGEEAKSNQDDDTDKMSDDDEGDDDSKDEEKDAKDEKDEKDEGDGEGDEGDDD